MSFQRSYPFGFLAHSPSLELRLGWLAGDPRDLPGLPPQCWDSKRTPVRLAVCICAAELIQASCSAASTSPSELLSLPV